MTRSIAATAAVFAVALALFSRSAAAAPPAASSGNELDARRFIVVARLVEHGRSPADALAAAARLTAADVEVLASHPDMLQPAGAMSETTWAVIIVAAIIAGIVILATSSSGSGFVMIH